MQSWPQARADLGMSPIIEGEVQGDTPLYVERYIYRDIEKSISGSNPLTLITMLGGSRVQEGHAGRGRTDILASQSLLVPPHWPTFWRYTGTVDFAAFYFPEQPVGMVERFQSLAKAAPAPLKFNDALVCATALQLTIELHKGPSADERFMAQLSNIMLEQAYRALTTPEAGGAPASHAQFVRLQIALKYIREHLADDLPAGLLADLTGVSLAHFRRLFQEAMGAPPHRYILAARLEQARKLLTMTGLPIAQIAQDSGFSSQSHLTACFRAAHAASPAEFRAQVKRGALP